MTPHRNWKRRDSEIRSFRRLIRLLAAAKEAQEERDAFQKSIHPYKAIVSPIRRLPPEVIMTIFLQLREEFYEVLDTRKGPWPLGQICSRWRSVALSCSELWSSMSLYTTPPNKAPSWTATDSLFETALRRTGQRDIEIGFPPIATPSDIWEPYSSRLKNVSFVVDYAYMRCDLAPFKRPLPSLTQLAVTVLSDPQMPVVEEVVDNFEDTPHLRIIFLRGVPSSGEGLQAPMGSAH